ncbi:MAG TPA: YceI family protein [Cyclobacteriaceae bacterium]
MKNSSLIGIVVAVIGSLSLMSFAAVIETLPVDINSTEIKWTGYHLAKSYEHWGHVTLKSGSISTDGEHITSGEFVIDMNTITSKDVEDLKDNAKLVGHLKADDFFGVEKYPEAKLVIKKSVKKAGNTYKTTADLTIKGITKEITFETEVKSLNANQIEAIADIRIRRTDYNVMYGWSLSNAILDDHFRLQVNLVANK